MNHLGALEYCHGKPLFLRYTLICVNTDIPAFMGHDARVYNLIKNDIATIPSVNARALIKRKVAVEINTGVPE